MFDISSVVKGVSTYGRDRIEYIALDLIDPDERNFYSLDGLEELASNIELLGLQQPIRVRPGEDGHYIVVSGHRRRAACMLIAEGGSEQFSAGVPCIVERGDVSAELQELRLIYANSSTRVLSSAEISRQAERVTDLLYKLKEQGYEFPGRMRDHVAEACNVSRSKLARLNAIRSNLAPELLALFDSGAMQEGNAYRLSQEPDDVQNRVLSGVGEAVGGMTADVLDIVIDQCKKTADQVRPETDHEKNDGRTDAGFDFDVDGYLAERALEDALYRKMLEHYADDFLERAFAGKQPVVSRKDGIERLKKEFRHSGRCDSCVDANGSGAGMELHDCIKHTRITRSWTEVYDMLCLIALRKCSKKKPVVSRMDTGWITDRNPEESSDYILWYGNNYREVCYYDAEKGVWLMWKGDSEQIMSAHGWLPLSPLPEFPKCGGGT